MNRFIALFLHPLAKLILTTKAGKAVLVFNRRFNPVLHQYAPIPINIPKYYYTYSLPSEKNLPVVSIVTPNLNYGHFLEETIKSVLAQNYPKLEYIIQDGGSTDGTVNLLNKYRSEITYAESCEDSGQGEAINRGFRHTTGEIMGWLNSDDLLLPGALAYVVNYFLKHPEVDVVYGLRVNINIEGKEIGRRIIPPHDDKALKYVDLIPQETLFWRRQIWETTGGYIDESYQYAMDWELLLRFIDARAGFYRLPRFLGAFRVHPAQKTTVLIDLGRKEKQRLYKRYHGRIMEVSEARTQAIPYLLGSIWQSVLYYLGLFAR